MTQHHALLDDLAAAGITVRVANGELVAGPPSVITPEARGFLRRHRAELLTALADSADRIGIVDSDCATPRADAERAARATCAAAGRGAGPETAVEPRWRGEGLALGDLRPCLWCRNLTIMGRCLAAWRGKLRAARDWGPTFPGQPTRCIEYEPAADDPDQRPGRERWPELIPSQARIQVG